MPQLSEPLAATVRYEKFILYETSSHYYLVAYDDGETTFRILKIDRRCSFSSTLSDILHEDPCNYSKDDLVEVLQMIDEGNKTTGGLHKVTAAYGLVGFVKFLGSYYFTLVTQKKPVGRVGGHYVYSVKSTEMFSVRPKDEPDHNALRTMWKKLNKRLNQTSSEIAESRYLGLFQFVDITRDFFFSYSYDLTQTLQHNFIVSGTKAFPPGTSPPSQDMFEWNHYQTGEFKAACGSQSASVWLLPIIHGSFQQRRFSVFGRAFDLILIARRSRHYAGTRYLKRGTSVHGKVANDCEIEQILQLHDGRKDQFCSYVQMRGSIPTYWYQETSVTLPKPPILVNRVDPWYLATFEHFGDLIRRYSVPVIVLDLVKQQERRPRESIVGREFRQAVDEINLSMPQGMQLRYFALDYTRASKLKGLSADDTGAKPAVKGLSSSAGGGDNTKATVAAGQQHVTKEIMLENTRGGGGDNVAGDVDGETPRSNIRNSINRAGGISSSSELQAAAAGEEGVAGKGSSVAGGGGGGGGAGGASKRVDMLSELESIAQVALLETGFFCNSTDHLNRIAVVSERNLSVSKEQGFLEQRGVLRTNCIDCLDRTNVGQYAMGTQFLAAAMVALGLLDATDTSVLEPLNPIHTSLVDMYSELGDRIALQYGGSEAHKKMSTGQGQAASTSQHGLELLTSIKRYYSNAFTDMVKQDAMNVFLGLYLPHDSAVHLWDLDSDYHLHNRLLKPSLPNYYNLLYKKGRDVTVNAIEFPVPPTSASASVSAAVVAEVLDGADDSIPVHKAGGGSEDHDGGTTDEKSKVKEEKEEEEEDKNEEEEKNSKRLTREKKNREVMMSGSQSLEILTVADKTSSADKITTKEKTATDEDVRDDGNLTFFPTLRQLEDDNDSDDDDAAAAADATITTTYPLVDRYFINEDAIQQREALTTQLSTEILPSELASKYKQIKLKASRSQQSLSPTAALDSVSISNENSPAAGRSTSRPRSAMVRNEDKNPNQAGGLTRLTSSTSMTAFGGGGVPQLDEGGDSTFDDDDDDEHANEEVLRTISLNEQRKSRVTHTLNNVNQAVGLWWRDSLSDNVAERQWAIDPGSMVTEDGSTYYSNYERTHRPEKLTFFDSVLSSESFLLPSAYSTEKRTDITSRSISNNNKIFSSSLGGDRTSELFLPLSPSRQPSQRFLFATDTDVSASVVGSRDNSGFHTSRSTIKLTDASAAADASSSGDSRSRTAAPIMSNTYDEDSASNPHMPVGAGVWSWISSSSSLLFPQSPHNLGATGSGADGGIAPGSGEATGSPGSNGGNSGSNARSSSLLFGSPLAPSMSIAETTAGAQPSSATRGAGQNSNPLILGSYGRSASLLDLFDESTYRDQDPCSVVGAQQPPATGVVRTGTWGSAFPISGGGDSDIIGNDMIAGMLIEPLGSRRPEDVATEAEFTDSLRESTIAVDDVDGMRHLATVGCVNHVVSSGAYEGLTCDHSLLSYWGNAFDSLVHSEGDAHSSAIPDPWMPLELVPFHFPHISTHSTNTNTNTTSNSTSNSTSTSTSTTSACAPKSSSNILDTGRSVRGSGDVESRSKERTDYAIPDTSSAFVDRDALKATMPALPVQIRDACSALGTNHNPSDVTSASSADNKPGGSAVTSDDSSSSSSSSSYHHRLSKKIIVNIHQQLSYQGGRLSSTSTGTDTNSSTTGIDTSSLSPSVAAAVLRGHGSLSGERGGPTGTGGTGTGSSYFVPTSRGSSSHNKDKEKEQKKNWLSDEYIAGYPTRVPHANQYGQVIWPSSNVPTAGRSRQKQQQKLRRGLAVTSDDDNGQDNWSSLHRSESEYDYQIQSWSRDINIGNLSRRFGANSGDVARAAFEKSTYYSDGGVLQTAVEDMESIVHDIHNSSELFVADINTGTDTDAAYQSNIALQSNLLRAQEEIMTSLKLLRKVFGGTCDLNYTESSLDLLESLEQLTVESKPAEFNESLSALSSSSDQIKQHHSPRNISSLFPSTVTAAESSSTTKNRSSSSCSSRCCCCCCCCDKNYIGQSCPRCTNKRGGSSTNTKVKTVSFAGGVRMQYNTRLQQMRRSLSPSRSASPIQYERIVPREDLPNSAVKGEEKGERKIAASCVEAEQRADTSCVVVSVLEAPNPNEAEYEEFRLISRDLYVHATNPCLQMNEIGVRSFNGRATRTLAVKAGGSF